MRCAEEAASKLRVKKEKPVSPQSQQGTMLTTLKRIVQEMNQIPALDTALFRLASRVKQTLDVDSCSIYLADYDTQEFILKATDGLHPDAVEQVRIGFSEGLIGLVGQREEPLNIVNAHSHPRFKHYPEVNTVRAGLLFVVSRDLVKDTYTRDMMPVLWSKWLNNYKRMETAFKKDVWNANPSGLCRRHCVVLECVHNGSN